MIRLSFVLLALTIFASPAFPISHHALQVSLNPASGEIRVNDKLRLKQAARQLEFSIRDGLEISTPDSFTLSDLGKDGRYRVYRLQSDRPTRQFSISIRGVIRSELRSSGNAYDRGITSSSGQISAEGVYLGPASGWYPYTGERISFEMTVDMPNGWKAVSQGKGTHEEGRSRWRDDSPQEGIYLVANRFHHYREGRAEVYLRSDDEALAQRYLRVTHHYLDRFESQIGPYPYPKFALVENTWESGFGMPSFTLLGSKVIRLPFILHSSYPHEILHNWWGNGVYVDYSQGNWSEGLTTYLADHAIQNDQGRGDSYRRRLLQRFADHAGQGRDFPLKQFVARHSGRAQAVGYGKTAMLFHMLKLHIGDDAFRQGLRVFYERHRFKEAGWHDIEAVMSQVAGKDLSAFFDRWINETGAPILSVNTERADGRIKAITIKQKQDSAPFPFTVPVRLTMENGKVSRYPVTLVDRQASLPLPEATSIAQIQVDPEFDVFRTLHADESPPSISGLLGAERITIVTPSTGDRASQNAYRALAQQWAEDKRVRVIDDRSRIPPTGAIWILGQQNAHLTTLNPDWMHSSLTIDGKKIRFRDNSVVLVTAQPTGRFVGLIHLETAQAGPALARKIPHYGRYGYLTFKGAKARNTLKGEWPAHSQALTIRP